MKKKRSVSFRERKYESIALQALQESARQLDGQGSVIKFIDNLLTESEKITLGRRILIAQMIMAGATRYEIQNKLDVSPNTVALTRKWLQAQLPAYDDVLKEQAALAKERSAARSQKENESRQRQNFADPLTFRGMRQRYPAHFLLFNLAEELLNRLGK